MPITEIRDPSHAGSWYSADRKELSGQLDGWLDQVETPVQPIVSEITDPINTLPVPGARIIIAPHAGYAYSGPAAAWAYKSWDVTNIERVFLLGPSHHHYLEKCALSKLDEYATPLGNLIVDKETTDELFQTGQFEYMSQSVDEAEHSLEMHLPYIYKILSRTFTSPDQYPKLVPIMVGNTTAQTETAIGRLLAPYLADPKTAFVISSDFAHWGDRFRYTYYVADPTNDAGSAVSKYALHKPAATRGASSTQQQQQQKQQVAIHESIKHVDFQCMAACESGRHSDWNDVLARTRNTVCGRHPIGCVLAGIEQMDSVLGGDGRDQDQDQESTAAATESAAAASGKDGGKTPRAKFRFVKYDRSGLVDNPRDSSVSYASAFAVL